jgi:signal transduction histidine kinase
VLSIKDESHEIRRNVLERIFFHDLLNVAGGVRGLTEVLRSRVPDTLRSEVDLLYTSLHYLGDSTTPPTPRRAAHTTAPPPRPVHRGSLDFLRAGLEAYGRGPASRGVQVVLAGDAEDFRLHVDPMILRRVIGNMIKNAVEASRAGQAVTLDCRKADGWGVITVHNEAVMPRKVQLQVFNRSFSTKGPGRGLGTYSILLLTERYLGGRVSFTSTPEGGTVFRVQLPLA